ncbi:MAG: cytochrome C [Nitrospirae bacterium]|nr:MAG: cytochrome C [Nitrospirota bacterium]
MRNLLFSLLVFTVIIVTCPSGVFGAGPHDSLSCTGCHSIHDAKDDLIFAVKANKVAKNPKTKKPFKGVTALCLGCHASSKQGGMDIKPISSHKSHPFGITKINNKVARVPKSLLRDGRFECVSCHDPHPSNPNYKYLRVSTKGGAEMDRFCSLCHPAKVDKKHRTSTSKVFTSMDETKVK